ncbi:MAG: hypothetical protein KJO07_00180 [Deltaproteobacteria bacterium]|nr:hypothetical protein [Deltaproteobacteria bacterium]
MTAVCYRCFYRGPAQDDQRCPACDFALITEADEPTCEKHLADIMGRYSVRAGAPKLPGIKTHHGLPGAARQRFFAVGTVAPPDEPESEAAVVRQDAGPVTTTVPKVVRLAPQAEKRADTDVRGGTAVGLARRSFGALEVACVLLGALAAGVGAAFLGTAL